MVAQRGGESDRPSRKTKTDGTFGHFDGVTYPSVVYLFYLLTGLLLAMLTKDENYQHRRQQDIFYGA
jgi:hypothetical protein